MHRQNRISALLVATALVCSTVALADSHNPKMKTFKGAQDMELASMGMAGVEAFLTDIISVDEDAPLTCGLFRLEKSNPLEYAYTYNEVKIIVAGEMTLTEADGETFHATEGDMVYFKKGAEITFSSNSSGLAFYCGQRGPL